MSIPKREQHVNYASSPLNGAINNSVTTLDVDTGSLFPSVGNFRIMVDSEIMVCTARSTNTLTVVRGQDGTTAASHSDNADVAMIYSQQGLNRLFHDQGGLWGYAGGHPVQGIFNDAGDSLLTTTDFTWTNQGGASITDSNGRITLRCTTDSATNLRILTRTPGGGSWTYIAAFQAVAFGDGAMYPHFGLGFRESSTGKLVVLGFGTAGSFQTRLSVGKWTDHDTLSTDPNFTLDNRFLQTNDVVWMKAEYDGTNIKLFVSLDGFEWIQIFSEAKATFLTTAPDQIVWYGSNTQNSAAGASELLVSLVHWHKE